MTDKSIEARIREHYVAETGEWLVEKGKVKEAKLLKEACETIEKLRRNYAQSEQNYYRMMMETAEKKRNLDEREKAIEEKEKSLFNRVKSAKEGLEYLLESVK